MLGIALFEPDIPQNTGTIIRFCACMGTALHIIEPMGFIWDDNKLKRSMMDYFTHAHIIKHKSWQHFKTYATTHEKRLLLATTKANIYANDMEFGENDICIFGSESQGAPDFVHESVDTRLKIPMVKEVRSYNLAMSVAVVSTLYCTQHNTWSHV